VAEAKPKAPIPYTRHTLTKADEDAVLAALRSGRIAQGPIAADFESRFAHKLGAAHAICVSNGTVALELALEALGVGPGDEVIVPTLTFLATANAVCRVGATPVFADVETDTLNLDPASVQSVLTPRCVGAIPVHFAGHPADMSALRRVVGRERFLLEDAAHALGGVLDEQPAGSLGDVACFSFHPAKLITSGEGGAVVTSRQELAQRLRDLREHGMVRDPARFRGLGFSPELREEAEGPWIYEQHQLGTNTRIPEPAAALLRSQLDRMQRLLTRRTDLAAAYDDALRGLPGLELPTQREGARSAWHLYRIRLGAEAPIRRRSLYEFLHARGIQVQVHYIPVHLQPYYRQALGTAYGDFPVAEAAYLESLSLPLFPDMTEEHTYRVVDAIRSAFGGAAS